MHLPITPVVGMAAQSALDTSANQFQVSVTSTNRQVQFANDAVVGASWLFSGGSSLAGDPLVVHGSNGTSPHNFDFIQDTGVFTLSTFIKPGSFTGGYMALFDTDEGTSGNNGFNLGLASDGSLHLVIAEANSTPRFVGQTAAGLVSANAWYHVVVVGNGPGQPVSFYVTPVAQQTVVAFASSTVIGGADGDYPTDATHDLTIGAQAAVGYAPFSGQMVDEAIYNRALSLTEIQQLYDYTRPANSTVVGRNLFYDNNLAGIDDGVGVDPPNGNPNSQNDDDFAIDPNKVAYLGNGSDEMSTDAQFLSHTSNSNLGINGLMVDLSGTHGTITASDFVFKTGDDTGFNVVPTSSLPNQISVRTGAGNGGSDRIEIVWNTVNSGAGFHASPIINTWLEVELKANADTGLAQGAGLPAGIGDRFFFASLVGDSVDNGNTGTAVVNANDEIAARNHPSASGDITVIYDYNKDGVVNATDQIIVRNGGHPSLDWIFSTSPFAPQGGGSSSPGGSSSTGGAVATALAGTSTSSSSSWVGGRLTSMGDLNSGTAASYFQSLASSGTAAALATTRVLAQADTAVDRLADNLGVDDELLDSLLADLGAE